MVRRIWRGILEIEFGRQEGRQSIRVNGKMGWPFYQCEDPILLTSFSSPFSRLPNSFPGFVDSYSSRLVPAPPGSVFSVRGSRRINEFRREVTRSNSLHFGTLGVLRVLRGFSSRSSSFPPKKREHREPQPAHGVRESFRLPDFRRSRRAWTAVLLCSCPRPPLDRPLVRP